MILFWYSTASSWQDKSNGIADFVAASKAVTPAVVHIKTLLKSSTELILENLIARKQRSCNGFRFWYLITRMDI
jgi:hypothetical protein